MSREDDFAARMAADTTLMAILTGGVHKAGTVGSLGISRDTTPSAFDSNGYLKPAALVRQRGQVPDGVVRDGMAQEVSTAQIVEVWLYQDGSYDQIEAAMNRLYVLFEGYAFTGTFPVEYVNHIARQRDDGALNGASLERMDFLVRSIR